MLPQNALTSQPKHVKSCRPEIYRWRFNIDTWIVAVSVKNYMAVKCVLYQTQKICLAHNMLISRYQQQCQQDVLTNMSEYYYTQVDFSAGLVLI